MRSTQLDDVLERAGLSAVVLERLRRLPATRYVWASLPEEGRSASHVQTSMQDTGNFLTIKS